MNLFCCKFISILCVFFLFPQQQNAEPCFKQMATLGKPVFDTPSFVFQNLNRRSYAVDLSSDVREAIAQIRKVLDLTPAVNDPLKGFCAQAGDCIMSSHNLQRYLRVFNIETRRIRVDHMGKMLRYGGELVPSDAYHFFLIIPATESRPEIIVDSTFLQFFDVKPDTHPIFVGTRADLINFFRLHHQSIQLRWIGGGKYIPDEPADFVAHNYGFNSNEDRKQDDSIPAPRTSYGSIKLQGYSDPYFTLILNSSTMLKVR